MNAWKFRHEGSPVASADLPFDQVMQGLIDGKIHPEDEVKGANDTVWMKFEDHPAFAEIISELEPEPEKEHEEESNLDMNPMIDVALVLLIFFILTTTYAHLQKIIEAAEVDKSKKDNIKMVTKAEADRTMVRVRATFKDGQTTIFVNDTATPLDDLIDVLRPYAKDPDRRTLLLDHDRKVPHGTIVAIQDRAKSAGMTKVALQVP